MKAEKYLLKGQISVDRTSVTPINLPESILIDVLDNGNSVDGTIARLLPDQNEDSNVFVYEYSMWVNRGVKITLIPSDSRYF